MKQLSMEELNKITELIIGAAIDLSKSSATSVVKA